MTLGRGFAVVEVDPAIEGRTIRLGDREGDSDEEAGGGVGGTVVFVPVQRLKDGRVCWEFEDGAVDDVGAVGVDDHAGVVAEIVACAAEGGWADFAEVANGGGDLGRGSVGVEGSLDEEVLGHGGVGLEAKARY